MHGFFILYLCYLFLDWLVKKTIQKLVLVVTSVAKKEDIERWQFNIECDKSANETTYVSSHTNLLFRIVFND